MPEMITFDLEGWKAAESVSKGQIILVESPVLSCPDNVPQGWKKLAKKVAKIEPDRKPDECQDTLPPWSSVTLNEAIIRLLYGFEKSPVPVKRLILELYNAKDSCVDSPFESLVKKAMALILKEAPKLGISKSTTGSLYEVLRVLTTKVCVTTEGGAVLFRKLGSIQHSCMPNCMFIPRGHSGHLIAIRDLVVGEPISCSHIPTNCLRASIDSRQAWLRGVAGTRCRSDCCTSGFDVRRRVICPRCKDGQCLAAKSIATSKWVGQKCNEEMEEAEAIDVNKEGQLIKKIIYLNEADIDISRLLQFTQAAISDAEKYFGKAHFCYQQLLLLQCGLALHSLCSGAPSLRMFTSWVRMLVDVYNFSAETKLPFEGMDELVHILLAPGTLQMAVKLLGSLSNQTDLVSATAVATFSLFVEQACECLLLIEGPESSHTSDGLKLKNWWLKKFNAWRARIEQAAEEKSGLTEETNLTTDTTAEETPLISEEEIMPKIENKSFVKNHTTTLVVSLLLTAALVWAVRRRSH